VKFVPSVNSRYWSALAVASIFGANLGDFLSDVLRLGHLYGLPILIVLLAIVFLAANWIKDNSIYLFWAAIIIIRAAATNVADSFHDFKIGLAYSIPAVALVLLAVNVVWRFAGRDASSGNQIPINGFYWTSMVLAGVLGTFGGDYLSYPAGLGNLWAMLISATAALVVLAVRWRAVRHDVFSYWIIIALIRTAGTAGGDLLAHGAVGLGPSTAITALTFAVAIFVIYGRSKRNLLEAK